MTVVEYRRKPFVVRALQFTGDNGDALMEFVGGASSVYQRYFMGEPEYMVFALNKECSKEATPGEWVIYEQHEFIVLSDEQFRAEYDALPVGRSIKRPGPDHMPEVVETLGMEATDKFVTDPSDACPKDGCGERMWQWPNPTGGDSWYFACVNGHALWVGK